MQSIIERRRHSRRYDHQGTVEIRLNESSADITILAADIETNDSGMCVVTHDRLEQGNVVDVRNALSRESKSAKVVWVTEYYPNLYKVGLMFILGSSGLFTA